MARPEKRTRRVSQTHDRDQNLFFSALKRETRARFRSAEASAPAASWGGFFSSPPPELPPAPARTPKAQIVAAETVDVSVVVATAAHPSDSRARAFFSRVFPIFLLLY